jgi:hypothetical protein
MKPICICYSLVGTALSFQSPTYQHIRVFMTSHYWCMYALAMGVCFYLGDPPKGVRGWVQYSGGQYGYGTVQFCSVALVGPSCSETAVLSWLDQVAQRRRCSGRCVRFAEVVAAIRDGRMCVVLSALCTLSVGE